MRLFHSMIVCAFSCAIPAIASAGSSLVNTGFETPPAPVGSFTNYSAGSDIGGWTAVGTQVSTVSTSFTQLGFNFVAHEGAQWLDLTGFAANATDGVTQTIDTVPGATYTVKFWVGNIVDTGGVFGTTSTVIFKANGVATAAATNSSGAGGNTQVWEEFTRSFVASQTSTTFEFLSGDSAGDNTNGLDQISVSESLPTGPAAIPLPTALVQFALALPLLPAGAMWMRRRSNVSV